MLLSVPVFLVTIYILAGFILPTDGKNGTRAKVFNFLLDYVFGNNRPCYVITRERREKDKVVQRVKGNPFNQIARGPGIIISDCDHAVAVSDGINFKGVLEPGVIFTNFGDQIVRTVDLRPQLRTATPQALTKDGIAVKALFFAPCQIDRGGLEPQLGQSFPYRKSAAFKAIHHQGIYNPTTEKRGGEQQTWEDLPLIIGTPILQDILSRYHFDELYGPPDANGKLPRQRIAIELATKLRQELKPLGIYFIGGGISNILPVQEEVLEQRVSSWQAEWTRKAMRKQAQSQQKRLRIIEQARAEAQSKLIMRLGEQLAELERDGASVTPAKVLPYFLRIIEELAMRPSLRRYLPRDAGQDVRRMRESIE